MDQGGPWPMLANTWLRQCMRATPAGLLFGWLNLHFNHFIQISISSRHSTWVTKMRRWLNFLTPPHFGHPLLRLPKVGHTIFFSFSLLFSLSTLYLVGAVEVETTFWVTKLEKWVIKMSFSYSNLVILLELLWESLSSWFRTGIESFRLARRVENIIKQNLLLLH